MAPGPPVAFGFASGKSEANVQGIHSPDGTLIIVDEGGGIPALVGANLISSLMASSEDRALVIGNPPTDDPGSWFETICTNGLWKVITIPAYDSPNVCPNPDCRAAVYKPGEPCTQCGAPTEYCPPEIAKNLVSRQWIDDQIATWGADDPWIVARVLALFPSTSSRRAIPPAWAEWVLWNVKQAPDGTIGEGIIEGTPVLDDTAPKSQWIRLGVDVASDGGDEMVVAVADGTELRILDHWSGAASADQVINAERVATWIRWAQAEQARRGYTDHPVRVKIDATGIGAGTADELERLKRDADSEFHHTAAIVKVIAAETPNEWEYANRRAEGWFTLRELCRKRDIRLRIGDRELKQLTLPTFKQNSSGKILVESKADMRNRGLNSPDRADALILSVYEPTGISSGQQSNAEQLANAQLPAHVGSVGQFAPDDRFGVDLSRAWQRG